MLDIGKRGGEGREGEGSEGGIDYIASISPFLKKGLFEILRVDPVKFSSKNSFSRGL